VSDNNKLQTIQNEFTITVIMTNNVQQIY